MQAVKGCVEEFIAANELRMAVTRYPSAAAVFDKSEKETLVVLYGKRKGVCLPIIKGD